MSQEVKIEEPQITPTPEGEVKEQDSISGKDEVVKNYEALVQQQQAQISQLMKQQEQLMKQQEFNQKVNNQLNEALKQNIFNNPNKPQEHWVDSVINNQFEFGARHNYANGSAPADQIGVWFMKYMKEQEGASNEEVEKRMERISKYLKTGYQESQEPFVERNTKEIKYR